MSKKILLLGVLDSILLDVQQQVARPNFEYFRGTYEGDVASGSQGFLPFVRSVLSGL